MNDNEEINTIRNQPLTRDRIEQMLAECKDNLEGFGSFPSRMDDGPGAVSAMYTSFSFTEIKTLCEFALNVPANGGEY